VWFIIDVLRGGRVTAIGAATAIVVGCVGITPAAGYISPIWAMVLGALAALPSYAVIQWRPRTRLDETLDVLAAHGLAGLTGMLFIGFFAQRSWNGLSSGLLYGHPSQLGWQAIATLAAPAYAFVATYGILRAIGLCTALRATDREQALGMDIVQHGEEAYAHGEGAILVMSDAQTEIAPVRP
jgi:Amt family ammonium transporter